MVKARRPYIISKFQLHNNLNEFQVTSFSTQEEKSLTFTVVDSFLICPVSSVFYSVLLEVWMIGRQSRVKYRHFYTGTYTRLHHRSSLYTIDNYMYCHVYGKTPV